MPTQHWKGPVIPAVGDDLVAAWDGYTNSAGIITRASSVSSARASLTAATAAGAAVTTDTPAYFNIGGIFYYADGTKNSGVWALKPFNETERFEGSYSAGEKFTRGPNSQNALITATIPARPYDRFFTAWGMSAADCTAGSYNLCLLIMDGDGQLGRWNSGDTLASVGTFNMRTVPAGVDPQVILAVRLGSAATNTIQMNNNAAANKLMVTAQPITMA